MYSRYNIGMYDIECYKDNIYFSAREINGLYSVDINGGQAKFIGSFPGEGDKTRDLHSIVIRYKNELAFLPAVADNICIYNLDKGNFINYKYPIDESVMDSTNAQKVATAILIDHEVYVFGGNNPGILIFNFITKEIKVCEKWLEKVERHDLWRRSTYFCKDIAKIKDSIFVRLCKSNMVIEYDMRKEQFFIHDISDKRYPVISCALASADEELWMLYTDNDDRKIVSWNCQEGSKEIDLGGEVQDCTFAYECSIVSGREIWFFPFPRALPILIFNLDTKKIRTMYLNRINSDLKDEIGECIWFRKVYHDKVFFRTVRGNKLYCLKPNEEPMLDTDIFIDRKEFTDKIYDTTQILHEYKNDWVDGPCIEDLICLCVKNHNYTEAIVNSRYGEIIEKCINREC